MVNREKVIKGLAACMPQTEEDAAIGCDGCPYNGNPCSGDYQDNDHVNLPVRMIEDIRALLKAQEARLITDADFENTELVDSYEAMPAWIEYRRDEEWDEYNDEKNDEWSLVYQFNFESEFYRCWTSRPTDEQREAVKWE